MSDGDPLFDWLVAGGVLATNPAHTVRESYKKGAAVDDHPTPLAAREAVEVGGVSLQVVLDWVLRLNANGPEGLIERTASLLLVIQSVIG